MTDAKSTAGGVIWKKGRAEIPLGEAPKERCQRRGRQHTQLSSEEKGRALQAFIPLAKSLITPPKASAFHSQTRGTQAER